VIEEFQLYGYGKLNNFTMDNAVTFFQESIQVQSASENTSTFTISFTTYSPELARAVTKRVADLLISTTESAREAKAINTDEFIDGQIKQAEQDLRAQEEKMKNFKNVHMGKLPEQSAMNLNALSQLQAQLTATENMIQSARDQRNLLQLRLREQQQLSAVSQETENHLIGDGRNPRPDPAVQQLTEKKALLAEYMAKYTSNHPDIIKLTREIAELEQRINLESTTSAAATGIAPANSNRSIRPERTEITMVQIRAEIESRDREVERRTKEKEDIQRQIKTYQANLQLAPSLEQEILAMDREYQILQEKNANLQNRKFSAQLASSLVTSKKSDTYRIIDEANLPEKPEKSKRLQFALISIVAGLGAGLGAVYGREYIENTVSNAEEIQSLLGLPVLALIPDLSSNEKMKKQQGNKRTA
jgi:succinoglycan biosynthesis transport protein ExoP